MRRKDLVALKDQLPKSPQGPPGHKNATIEGTKITQAAVQDFEWTFEWKEHQRKGP